MAKTHINIGNFCLTSPKTAKDRPKTGWTRGAAHRVHMTTSTDTLTKLHPTDTGVYELTTESGSRYTIDLDAWTLVRETGIPIRPLVESGVLRRDSQTIKLVGIDRVVVGRRALLRIDLGVEGLGCITRDTTVVTSITAKVLAAV